MECYLETFVVVGRAGLLAKSLVVETVVWSANESVDMKAVMLVELKVGTKV